MHVKVSLIILEIKKNVLISIGRKCRYTIQNMLRLKKKFLPDIMGFIKSSFRYFVFY